MLITDQVAIAPGTDCIHAQRPTIDVKPLTIPEPLRVPAPPPLGRLKLPALATP